MNSKSEVLKERLQEVLTSLSTNKEVQLQKLEETFSAMIVQLEKRKKILLQEILSKYEVRKREIECELDSYAKKIKESDNVIIETKLIERFCSTFHVDFNVEDISNLNNIGGINEVNEVKSESKEKIINNKSRNSISHIRSYPPMPRILIIQNDNISPPQTAAAVLATHKMAYQVIYAFHDNVFESLSANMYEGIIVLGGNPGAYEEDLFPWLRAEKEFLRRGIYEDVPIFGICLGCQLLAECAGGKVYQGPKGVELGFKKWEWCEDNLSTQDQLTAMLKEKKLDEMVVLFHGDTFDLPLNVETKHGFEKVLLLAKTNLYNTLYKIGKYTYGFQGHPELNPKLLQLWCKGGWGTLNEKAGTMTQ